MEDPMPTNLSRLLLAGTISLGAVTPAVAQEECPTSGMTVRAVTVHPGPPRFFTGRGWLIEPSIDTLASETALQICETRSIGVIPSTRVWLRIHYGGTGEGWIPADAVEQSTERIALASLVPSIALMLPQQQESTTTELVQATEGVPGTTWPMAWMLLAVVLGMIAKAVFDRLECDDFDVRACLRQTVRSLVVAPMVFLGIGEVGNFALTSTGMMLYLGWAFQNGFFWQTVLARQTAAAAAGTLTNPAAAREPYVRGAPAT